MKTPSDKINVFERKLHKYQGDIVAQFNRESFKSPFGIYITQIKIHFKAF